MDCEFDEEAYDRDHLMEIEDIIDRAEELEGDSTANDIYQRKTYDLCPSCYREYVKNPLALEQKVPLGFSKN